MKSEPINESVPKNVKTTESHKIRFGGGGVSVPAKEVMAAEESTSRKINELWVRLRRSK